MTVSTRLGLSRGVLFESRHVTFGAKMNLLSKIRPDFFAAKLPIIAEFSTNETMGYSTTFFQVLHL